MLFSLLGIEPDFDIDTKKLEASYFQQQRLFHPDRFIGKPPAERQAAMQKSVDINQAYQKLKSPLTRAQTLLAMQKITIGTDNDSVKPSQALLVETLEWREAIDEANSVETLKIQQEALNAAHLHCLSDLSSLYRGQDWQGFAQSALRLGYLEKSQEAVRQKIKRMDKAAS